MESSRGEIIDRDNSEVERLLEYAENKHRGSLKRCQSVCGLHVKWTSVYSKPKDVYKADWLMRL